MRKEKEYLTILFADISRSRQCYLTLGDEQGQKLIAECLATSSLRPHTAIKGN